MVSSFISTAEEKNLVDISSFSSFKHSEQLQMNSLLDIKGSKKELSLA